MPAIAELFLPPQTLASCLVIGVYRDTRGASLRDADRVNYFPASPLFTVTWVAHGELRVSRHLCDLASLKATPALPKLAMMPPQNTPIMSWSPGAVTALTVGFFPDAWRLLGGDSSGTRLPGCLGAAFASLRSFDEPEQAWVSLCDALAPIWDRQRKRGGLSDWSGSNRVKDWAYHILGEVARAGPGSSIRTFERRLKRWTGQNKRSLEFFAQIEDLHRATLRAPGTAPAQLALAANFSDQSHMGRMVRRATGFSPARLNRMINEEEPFWCYRLMGQRF